MENPIEAIEREVARIKKEGFNPMEYMTSEAEIKNLREREFDDYENYALAGGKARKDFESCNIITASCATTGHRGGDSGHGCRTYVSLFDVASTDWDVRVTRDNGGSLREIEIVAGGDTELTTLSDAFIWLGNRLKEMSSGK